MRAMRPGTALFPLRLFLGGTFIYAGIQKLSDPGYLHPGAPTYIGTQLHSFANGTPGGFILRAFALPHPVAAGVGVAIAEILIGLLVAAGLMTRLAAAGGLGLNLLLFGTASWHTSPFFLGSDIVFVFAWLPFVLAGAAEQPALDHLISRPAPAGLARRMRMHPELAPAPSDSNAVLTRRALVAELGATALALAGIAALFKGPYRGPAGSPSATAQSSDAAPTSGSGSAHQASDTGTTPSVPANAVKVGPSSKVPKGQGALYNDPADGSADILIRGADGSLAAFSAVCTHAGCTVGYRGGEIVCPCHGGVFSATTGAVESGPPPQGLAKRTVLEQNGEIYAVPS
jgi:thiosulfate dehydrogenase [quinone] large subunit